MGGVEHDPPGPTPPGLLVDPLPGVPGRREGTIRRTMHIDVGHRPGPGSALPMAGAARDLVTPAGPGGPTVLAEVAMTAGFDEGRTLVQLETTPDAAWAAGLVGTRAGGGFRRHLDGLTPAGEARSLLRQVLDDLPAAMLISGYAWMRLARRSGIDASVLVPVDMEERMNDLCSGWRKGGSAMDSVRAGGGVPLQDCPPATDLVGTDTDGWHRIGPLAPDWMRRRRLLDVGLGPDGRFSVWAMFRDTVGEADGSEAVLHEYAVTVEGTGTTLESVVAEPRVLPFLECPGAAGAVGRLAGMDLAELPESVPVTLTRTDSCTHLNDLLRSLGGAAALVEAARAVV